MWRHGTRYENLLLKRAHHITSDFDGGLPASQPVFFAKRTQAKRPPLKAVVFDMDGTLTIPVHDFARMRLETGILEGDILAEVEKMEGDERRRCEEIIERIEGEGNERLELQPGVLELFDWLRRTTSLHVALVTRNSRKNVQYFTEWMIEQEKWSSDFVPFDNVITRECAPPKPDPTCLFQIAEHAQCDPKQMIMVGDTVYDVECGINAGTQTALFAAPVWTEEHDRVVDEHEPDFLISDMRFLMDILKENYK